MLEVITEMFKGVLITPYKMQVNQFMYIGRVL